MTILRLRSALSTHVRLGLYGVVPGRSALLGTEAISNLQIHCNDKPTRLGDYFEVTGSDMDRMVMEGDLTQCDFVGGGMKEGILEIQGSVGNHLADKMTGGQLRVAGSALDYAASGLRGGWVEIDGDVGQYAAAALPGKRQGMRGGDLTIRGSAGHWLASRMRRGLIVVHGTIDSGCAAHMLAGTIVLCGLAASPQAFGMKRGTVLLLANGSPELPAGFTPSESTELSYLSILLHALADRLPKWLVDNPISTTVMRSIGDRSVKGLGELLWLPIKTRGDGDDGNVDNTLDRDHRKGQG